MTYVEFFDKCSIENIGSCLTRIPERVIFIGNDSKLMTKYIEYYSKVFSERGENIEFLFQTTSKSNADKAIRLLSEIVETYDDCVFDITGGNEILLFALGAVFAMHPEKNIQIHRINFQNGTLFDCDKDGKTIYEGFPMLSVDEHIRIYGGSVVYGNIDQGYTYMWDLNPLFLKDLDIIWDICRADVSRWNKQIGCFAAVEALGYVSNDGLTITVPQAVLEAQSSMQYHVYFEEIVNKLLAKGLLKSYENSEEAGLKISYKNKRVKKFLTKAGLALEMKIFTAAKNTYDNGAPVYNDALNGVVIDWDGVACSKKGGYDTENEIDILLMHGTVPVFISCKNGAVTSDELYKLNTVAERFGGKYSKKVLIATALDPLDYVNQPLFQRAEDMDIKVITGIQNLDDNELKKKLKNLWNV